jgi:hypothetical protein
MFQLDAGVHCLHYDWLGPMFRSVSRRCLLAGAGFELLALVVCGQTLQRRSAVSGNCPRTHIRLTARTKDGLPSGALKLQDFRVDFTQGTAAIVSVSDGTPKKADSSDTDILFAIPPFSDLNDSITKPLVRALAKADNFKFKLAVLAPDGSVTPFTSDLALVRRKLADAISGKKRSLGRDAWPAAEQKAFLTLRVLPGRHVIVNLMAPSKLRESGEKQGFRNDMTLDLLAQYDMTQVYRLVMPVPIGLGIPGGDASGEGSVFLSGAIRHGNYSRYKRPARRRMRFGQPSTSMRHRRGEGLRTRSRHCSRTYSRILAAPTIWSFSQSSSVESARCTPSPCRRRSRGYEYLRQARYRCCQSQPQVHREGESPLADLQTLVSSASSDDITQDNAPCHG